MVPLYGDIYRSQTRRVHHQHGTGCYGHVNVVSSDIFLDVLGNRLLMENVQTDEDVMLGTSSPTSMLAHNKSQHVSSYNLSVGSITAANT